MNADPFARRVERLRRAWLIEMDKQYLAERACVVTSEDVTIGSSLSGAAPPWMETWIKPMPPSQMRTLAGQFVSNLRCRRITAAGVASR